jgi:alanine racemase
MFFLCQGLILSKALKAQKDAEDESNQIAIGNLRSEVITLRNEALEKDKILHSLLKRLKSSEARLYSLSKAEQKMQFEEKQQKDAKRIADLEYVLSVQVGLHRFKVQGLEKKLDKVTENFNVKQTKREISDTERLRVQKISTSFVEQKRNATMLPWNVIINSKIALPK